MGQHPRTGHFCPADPPQRAEIHQVGSSAERRATALAALGVKVQDGGKKKASKLGSDEPGIAGPHHLRQVAEDGLDAAAVEGACP